MGRGHYDNHSCSSSSSIDSNTNITDIHHHKGDPRIFAAPCKSSSVSSNTRNNCYSSKDLSTDLRLGLSISSLSYHDDLSSSPRGPRGHYNDWPPMKPLLRSMLAGKSNSRQENCLFVKVYMEGIPIGRKLDLLAHDGYDNLIVTLSQMFRTTILFPDVKGHISSRRYHILTYEDKEGDWMMVGDVPWEMFLTTVKRLKIVALANCQ